MKVKSVIHLLKMGQFIARRQRMIQKAFQTSEEIFKREMQLILEVILINLEMISVNGEVANSINNDYYEFIVEKFNAYFNEEISLKELISSAQSLKFENIYDTRMDEPDREERVTYIVNKLFELKYLLQLKRHQLAPLTGGEYKSVRYEKRILGIVLEKLGDKRYFNKKITTA